MERNILIERIIEFYFETGLLDESILKKEEIEIIVDDCLEKAEHIETIINTIIQRAKTHKGLDAVKLKELLLELERVRLNLEYKELVTTS